MIRQDILVIIDESIGVPGWTFFVCSKRGLEALLKAGGEQPQIWPFALSSKWVTFDEKLGKKIYRKLRVMNGKGQVDVHFSDVLPVVAALNAEEMAIEHQRTLLIGRVSDYFTPLFNAAIEARDKKLISQLFYQFPAMAVQRAFLIDRLCYGTNEKNNEDAFPELREPGVTLDNWYR